ncbi:hypothetical protein EDB83DRAFT_1848340 [Lactarius deliciosus]|nr:hypothetical protein EDB83DRAFT_1848340 [Lactarius deliciosus]
MQNHDVLTPTLPYYRSIPPKVSTIFEVPNWSNRPIDFRAVTSAYDQLLHPPRVCRALHAKFGSQRYANYVRAWTMPNVSSRSPVTLFIHIGYFVFAAFVRRLCSGNPLILEYTRFITRGSKPKFIAIDECIPMLYIRFLASLLAHHKRDGAARGCLHLQDSPMQQLQASSSAPVY